MFSGFQGTYDQLSLQIKMKESQPEGLVHQEGQVFFQRYGRNLL